MKRIAVISDISALGRCSLSAALPVISAIGAECCPIPGTVLTNQTGYESYKAKNLTDFMPEYIAEWKKISFSPDAILSGYLGDINQVRFVSRFIDTFGKNSLVAVDPAMAESGSIYKGFTDEMCRQIQALCAKSDIITPNLSEFCILTGEKYEDYLNKDKSYLTDRISEKAKALFGERLGNIIVTGVKCEDKILNIAMTKNDTLTFSSTQYPGDFSGTGDIFSAAVTAFLTTGCGLSESISRTISFIEKSVRETLTHPHDTNDGTDFQLFLKEI